MAEELDRNEPELHSFLDDIESLNPDGRKPEPAQDPEADSEQAYEDPEGQDEDGPWEESGDGDHHLGTAPRHERRRMATRPPRMPLVIGMLLVLTGIALGAWQASSPTATALTSLVRMGISPALLLLSGVLLTTLAMAQRGVMQSSSHRLLLAFEKEQGKVHRELHALLDEKMGQQREFAATNEADAFGKVAMMFSKVESMLSNLTKAMRLLNKPVIDIHSQIADMHDPIQKLGAGFKRLHEDFELLGKTQSEAAVNFEKKWESLVERQLTETDELLTKSDKVKKELLARLDAHLDEISEELKGLGGGKDVGETLEAAQAGLRTQVEELVARIETRLGEMAERIEAMPAGGGDDRLLSELQDSVTRILGAVQDISIAAPAAPAAPVHAPARRAKTPVGVGADSPAKGGGDAATGTGKKGGKAVMSAIERLKKLRGS